VSEFYDEIVFLDPTPTMQRLLALPRALLLSDAAAAESSSAVAASTAAAARPGTSAAATAAAVAGPSGGDGDAPMDAAPADGGGGGAAAAAAGAGSAAVPVKPATQTFTISQFYLTFDDAADLRAIHNANEFVKREIEGAPSRCVGASRCCVRRCSGVVQAWVVFRYASAVLRCRCRVADALACAAVLLCSPEGAAAARECEQGSCARLARHARRGHARGHPQGSGSRVESPCFACPVVFVCSVLCKTQDHGARDCPSP
jgi:hypothetical protein